MAKKIIAGSMIAIDKLESELRAIKDECGGDGVITPVTFIRTIKSVNRDLDSERIRLQARIEELEQALRPFANLYKYVHPDEDDECSIEHAALCSADEDTLKVKHVRHAAEALNRGKE